MTEQKAKVPDYGEPLKVDNSGRLWIENSALMTPFSTTTDIRIAESLNLLAGFPTDPKQMTERQALICGLIRADVEDREGDFAGHLDDLLSLMMGKERSEEGLYQIQWKYRDQSIRDSWKAQDHCKTIEDARRMKNHFAEQDDNIDWRIVRVRTKTEVVE